MKHITTILKILRLKELPKPLGRWKIENCNKKMNNKIDLSMKIIVVHVDNML